MGLLAFLFGCRRAAESPFQQKNGAWHYESTLIEGADGPSFRVLSPHYAKDKHRVYHGDTYRDGRDYFTTKRSRVVVVDQADPATFRYLDREYARDRAGVFFEGVRFAVKDVDSFELLDYGFARDRISGYFHQVAVPASDGRTFSWIDSHYAKDSVRVFYCALESARDGAPPVRRFVQMKGARPDSFTALDEGYATDAGQVYFRGAVLVTDASSFRLLQFGYAKTAAQVYYMGKAVARADATSFVTLERPTETADATDRNATYQLGRRTTARSQP